MIYTVQKIDGTHRCGRIVGLFCRKNVIVSVAKTIKRYCKRGEKGEVPRSPSQPSSQGVRPSRSAEAHKRPRARLAYNAPLASNWPECHSPEHSYGNNSATKSSLGLDGASRHRLPLFGPTSRSRTYAIRSARLGGCILRK